MNVALWVAQIVLAAVFLTSGIVKGTQPKDKLIATGQTGVAPFPLQVIRLTAFAELLAVAGLVLPWLTGIARVLTPAAAAGLVIVMIGAMASHSTLLRADRAVGRGNREARNVAANLVLMALCVFVVVGRLTY